MIYIQKKEAKAMYTVSFFGGKTDENHLLRLYFLKISYCNLHKVAKPPFFTTLIQNNHLKCGIFYTFKKHRHDGL